MKKLLSILILSILASACTVTPKAIPSATPELNQATFTPSVTVSLTPTTPAIIPTNALSTNPSETVSFTTSDGINLAGTLFGDGNTAVILAHQGTPGTDQQSWQPFARLLAERGYAALTFDFRGVGQSGGSLGYGNLALDVDAAVQFLKERGYEHIICIGASMGGTACIRSAQGHMFDGLIILASTLTAGSGGDVLHLTADDLGRLTPPKIFISADKDYATVVKNTREMFKLSPEPKELLFLPGTQHGTNLFASEAREELSATMLRFLGFIENQASAVLPALQPITLENSERIELLRTMKIPDYDKGQISQCSLAFSPNGGLLVGACGKNQVPIWNVQSGFLLRLLYNPPEQIVSCAFSPDGKQIACGGFDKTITLWDAVTGEQISRFVGQKASIWDIAFEPDGNSLASCSLGLIGGGEGDVRLWKMPDGEMIWSNTGTEDYLSVSYNPSGKVIAFGSIGGSVGLLDSATGELIHELTDSSQNTGNVAYSSSGHWLAAGSDDKRIYVWNTSNYELEAQLTGHTGYVNGVAFSPDETLLISGSHDRNVGIWNVSDQKLVTQLKGHEREVLRVAFNPDGNMIASISWDGTVRLWGVLQ